MSQILALDISGMPNRWIHADKAIEYYAKDLVAWELGEPIAIYHGGYKRDGTRSVLTSNSIIAIKNSDQCNHHERPVLLTNKTLFARDRFLCVYCGFKFSPNELTRDHIHPRFLGGEDIWMNVAASCSMCNAKKGHKTLKEAKMELLYLPYVPSHAEALILKNRKILGDQMEYLMPMIPKHSRILQLEK